tara:strand:- start:984 stop:1691 length:708 start_codon:yes stop_codon:yes gene_type:complete
MPAPAIAAVIAFIGRQGVQAAIKKYGQTAVRQAVKQKERGQEGKAYQTLKEKSKEYGKSLGKTGKTDPKDKNLQDKYDKMFDARGKYYENKSARELDDYINSPTTGRVDPKNPLKTRGSVRKLEKSPKLQQKRVKAQRTEKKNVQKKKPENIKARRDLIKTGLKAVGAGAVPVAGALAYEKWGKSRDDEPVKKMSAEERRERAEGYKKGGKVKKRKPKVRGAGIARKGVRPAKMR